MKTRILLSFGALIFSLSALNAQFEPGIKGGINFSSLTAYNGESRIGAHAGFFLHHRINKNWCVQPELLYSSEGQRYFTSFGDRIVVLDYVEIPVMIQYFPVRQFYLELGPQLGILASAKEKIENEGVKINVRDNYTAAQIGLNVGIGLSATPNLGFYGRYNFGLTDVSKFDNIIDQSRVGQIGVTFRINQIK